MLRCQICVCVCTSRITQDSTARRYHLMSKLTNQNQVRANGKADLVAPNDQGEVSALEMWLHPQTSQSFEPVRSCEPFVCEHTMS